MAQPHRTTSPLDLLQGMINGILIELGKALRGSHKDGGKGLSGTNARLRTMIPGVTENFHQALDDLECEIIRAKSVLLRDLEALREKRILLENPEIAAEQPKALEDSAETHEAEVVDPLGREMNRPSVDPSVKEEEISRSPEKDVTSELNKSHTPVPSGADVDSKAHILSDTKELNVDQPPIPPDSITEASHTKPIGLGIDTTGTGTTPAAAAADLPNSSIDSLFEVPEGEDNMGGDSDLIFADMDFALDDPNSSTQNHGLPQNSNTEFDLSTFGDVTQHFDMDGLTSGADVASVNDVDLSNMNKQDDMLNLNNNTSGGDGMDLDLDLGMAEADDSVFENIFFEGGDDAMNGGGEMEHEFDNAFFGLVDN